MVNVVTSIRPWIFAKPLRLLILTLSLLYSVSSFAFVISDIRVEGLQRISAGTVFGAIPYSVGDNIGSIEIRAIGAAQY